MKRFKLLQTPVALAALALGGLLPAVADPIDVPDPGFEVRSSFDPFVEGMDRYMQWGKESWRQWQRTANGGPQRIWNPGEPGCELREGYGGHAPEGDYVMWVTARYSDGLNYTTNLVTGGTNYMEAEVQLLTETFDPTKTYILTAKVGQHPTGLWGGYALQLMVGGTNVSGSTYAGSVNGGTLIAEDMNTVTVPTNRFVTARLRYAPNPANAGLAGQQLQVRLCALEISTNLPGSLTNTTYAVFDDVHLEGDVVPAGDTTPPTLTGSGMVDDKSGAPFPANTMVTYTVNFSEPMDASTVLAAGFTNAGTAPVTFGKITHIGAGQFTVQVTPTSAGTLRLGVPAGAYMTDLSSNALNTTSAILADTTLTVNADTGADGYWGVDSNGDWSDLANWSGGPVADGTDRTASLSTAFTAPRTLSVNTPRTIGNITFTDPTYNLWVSGNALTLDVSSGSPAIDVSPASRNLIMTAPLAGSKGLTKTGPGRLSLDATNTFSGTTTVNEGTLLFATHSSLGAGGRTVMASNATVAAGFAIDNTFLNHLVENGNSLTVALGNNSTNNLDFSSSTGANLPNASLGAVNLGATSGGFTTSGSTYTGTLAPNGATYRLGGGDGATLTLSAADALVGGNNLVVAGNVTLSGTNSGFNRTVTANAGTLTLNNANPLGSVSSYTINNGATVAAGSTTALGSPTTITLSGGTLSLNANSTVLSTPITLSGGGRVATPLNTDGNTVTLNGAISGSGPLTLLATATGNKRPIIRLGAAGSYSDATTFGTTGAGNLAVQSMVANALPVGTVLTLSNAVSGRFVEWDLNGADQTLAGLTASGYPAGTVIVNSSSTAATLTVNNSSDYTFDGLLGSTGYSGGTALWLSGDNFRLTKTGAGKLTLTAPTHYYTGDTTVSNGTLVVDGILPYSAVTVAAGGTFGGSGTVNGALTLSGTVSPGDSVGMLTTGNQTWNGGASYRFELSSALNSLAMDNLMINGTLDVQATAGNKFTLKLVSMADTTTPGLVPDFDGASPYTWTIATAIGGILNFDPSKFVIDASAFANPHSGVFTIGVQGNNLVVNYVIPPSLTGYGPLTSGSFPLTFSGPAGQTYSVLSSTNLALPLSSWTVLTSGTFSGGSDSYTDPSATNKQQYYRIQMP